MLLFVNYVQLPSVNNGNQLSITAVVIDPWQNSLEYVFKLPKYIFGQQYLLGWYILAINCQNISSVNNIMLLFGNQVSITFCLAINCQLRSITFCAINWLPKYISLGDIVDRRYILTISRICLYQPNSNMILLTEDIFWQFLEYVFISVCVRVCVRWQITRSLPYLLGLFQSHS